MKLIFIIGDGAVGKMTVGQQLSKITDLRLFHNHMAIELVLDVFGGYNGKAIIAMRDVIFSEFAKSNKYGFIFTYMWAFDQQEDWDYVEHVCDIFREYNAEIYFVELVAPQSIRLKRNITENRLKNKASKRDIEFSNNRIIEDNKKYRCVSNEGEIPYNNYIKIDNSTLSREVVAQLIKDRFEL